MSIYPILQFLQKSESMKINSIVSIDLPSKSNFNSRRWFFLSRRNCFSISRFICFCSRASADKQHIIMISSSREDFVDLSSFWLVLFCLLSGKRFLMTKIKRKTATILSKKIYLTSSIENNLMWREEKRRFIWWSIR